MEIAFLLESLQRAGATCLHARTGLISNILSYVQDILGTNVFDYGFGPFRWSAVQSADGFEKIRSKLAAKSFWEKLDLFSRINKAAEQG